MSNFKTVLLQRKYFQLHDVSQSQVPMTRIGGKTIDAEFHSDEDPSHIQVQCALVKAEPYTLAFRFLFGKQIEVPGVSGQSLVGFACERPERWLIAGDPNYLGRVYLTRKWDKGPWLDLLGWREDNGKGGSRLDFMVIEPEELRITKLKSDESGLRGFKRKHMHNSRKPLRNITELVSGRVPAMF